MRIAVLGTGTVGRTVAARLLELGHQVTTGTRDPEATAARAAAGESYRDWAARVGAATATFADAAAAAEVVVNATSGAASLGVLAQAGAKHLAGKILIDIANPLDFPDGGPPALLYCNDDSLGERIQRAFPDARVVKTLNTLTAELMVRPGSLPDAGTVFVSGDDAGAKTTVAGLLKEFGHTDVIDLGDITTARGAEMLLPVWLRTMGALGTAAFNFKVVR
ncbi:NADPH-dependent F420 reductase [Glycomyces terrestris]|uniref:NADP oxidoreductase n=1 Tax=Glycomyces terrestris TaxID=2493553 RepID=A0A426V4C8_9ACTN|nr:NAD(P)-binding domain-containing protein [Glycomyces terrestris]RRS01727.1 NADP oxidoreductase [Glycomyces terrestris]